MNINFSREFYIVILAFCIALTGNTQSAETDWPALKQINIAPSFGPDKDKGKELKPEFPNAARTLNGKVVTLDGYIYPLTNGKTHQHFVLSALPLATCFFCGGAGPETVAEVFSVKPVPFTEKKITLKGKLTLIESRENDLMYRLTEAELLP